MAAKGRESSSAVGIGVRFSPLAYRVVSISFEEIEDDQGLPAHRTITAHLLVQPRKAQPESFGGAGIGHSETADPLAKLVTRDRDFLWHGAGLMYSMSIYSQ